MQISRHWRMNEQRYRLVGTRYANGSVSLQGRPVTKTMEAAPASQPRMEERPEREAQVNAA